MTDHKTIGGPIRHMVEQHRVDLVKLKAFTFVLSSYVYKTGTIQVRCKKVCIVDKYSTVTRGQAQSSNH